jgi:hypothetical protein
MVYPSADTVEAALETLLDIFQPAVFNEVRTQL